MRGKFFAAIIIAELLSVGVCASVITVGTGTSVSSCPLSTEYIDSRAQAIYLASEIGVERTFNSLALYVTTTPGQKMNSFTIRLKHTNLSSYGSTPTWESDGWTTVYQTNQTVSTTGWVTFPFTTPFSYNGVQSLMVDISFNNTSYSSFGYCRFTYVSTNRTIAYGSKNNEPDPLTWSGSTPSTGGGSKSIINIQLGYDPVMVTVPDVTGLSQADAQSAITSANLLVGTVTTTYHSTVPAGTVVSQSPAAGQSAETKSAVNLVVSLGKIYSGGSGTAADPYIIASKEDVLKMSVTPANNSACFLMTEDIDMLGQVFSQAVIAPDTDNSTYGFQGVKFTGIFDGNNHKITNLTIDAPTQYYAALFGYVGHGGQIKNLGLETINITGYFYVGGLAGYNYKGTVTSCDSTGNVTGSSNVGGLVGYNNEGAFTTCYFGGSVSGSNAGGLAGYNYKGTLTSCYSAGSVSGGTDVGGLVGYNRGPVTDCYSISNIIGSSDVGGLVGRNDECQINSCYSAGSVSGSSFGIGGLVGSYYYGSVVASFWDIESSGQTTSGGGVGKTTLQMQDMFTFSSNNWGNNWTIDSGNDYPRLVWENAVGTVMTAPTITMAGSGTAGDPWIIASKDDFLQVCGGIIFWNKYYRLDVDIDLSGEAYSNSLIGYDKNSTFTGGFDGNGHTISNLTINAPDRSSVGLFGYVGSGGQVKNVGLENINVTGYSSVGGLAGYNEGGTINSCYSTGSITGQSSVGGLLGGNTGTLTSCSFSGSVSSPPHGQYIGGLAGGNSGTLTACYSTGSVSGSSILYAGGLVGNSSGTLTSCYSSVSVSSLSNSENIGGLAGAIDYNGIVTSCYSTGAVNGSPDSQSVGGLAGYTRGAITACYSTGSVSGPSNSQSVGGLVAGVISHGSIITSFWDIQTSGQTTSGGGVGKTTVQMKDVFTYSSNNWGSEWTIDPGNDYPHLAWENAAGTVITAPTIPMSGSGTAGDPWIIASKEDFERVCNGIFFWNKYCRLDTDIDMSGAVYSFSLIGYDGINNFTGGFDGNGHTISNLTIQAPTKDYVGLFGYIGSGSQVKNLGLENINITGYSGVGGLVGYNEGGTITSCHLSGSINGYSKVGGLAGYNYGTLASCHSSGSVSGSSEVGGLVGYHYGTLTSCYSTSSVSGSSCVGGLVGRNENYSTFTSCYSAGSVNGTSCAGGLVGYNNYGTITCCYSTSSVSGSSAVGGLIGDNRGPLTCCYSSGSVSGSSGSQNVGGLVGVNGRNVTASFWDIQTSGQTTSFSGTGLTTAQMQTQSTFTSAGWDFSNTDGNPPVWYMDGTDYPVLTWQLPSVTVPDAVGMTQSDAQTVLIAANFTVGITKVWSNSIPAGVVISQMPVGGTMAGYGSWINLTVSLGRPVVPNVVGKTQAAAQTAITAVSLTTGSITQIYSDSVAAGNVISQTPAAGTAVDIGSAVDLVLSKGKPVVPNVVGMTQTNAQLAIISAGLSVGTVTTAYHNSISAGNVISQSPAGGSSVNTCTAVNLLISLGRPVVPNVVGMTQTNAQSAIVSAGLSVGTEATAYHNSISAGNIISQSPVGGTSVNIGSNVNLVISLGKAYSGGSGTTEDPYLISTPQDLNKIGTIPADWNKYFKLAADIDMSSYTGTQYKIIGNFTTPFTGTFDGNGHKIANIKYIVSSPDYCIGLFGTILSDGEIKNLTLVNTHISCSVTSNCTMGLLAGVSYGKITNCHIKNGYVKNPYIWPTTALGEVVGGLVGQVGGNGNAYSDALIADCSVKDTTVIGAQSGGLVGQNYAIIRNCWIYNINVDGTTNAGGLAGVSVFDGTVMNCAVHGVVKGKQNAGGLIGYVPGLVGDYHPLVSQSYAICNVWSDIDCGGLIGYVSNQSKVINCYSLGSVAGSYPAGLVSYLANFTGIDPSVENCYSAVKSSGSGLVSRAHTGGGPVTVYNSFWDVNVSGTSYSVRGTGKTTAQMKTQSTFVGWDFANTWYMLDYPSLKWEINPLQAQIDAAVNGATITVQPGLYQGRLYFKGKNITLTSINPQDPNIVASAVIRGAGVGPVVTFAGTETSACVLQGFTITGGVNSGRGGGVAGNSTHAGIFNCRIQDNAAAYGGGIDSFHGRIEKCIIANNSASANGGGFAVCGGVITNCLVYGNSAGAYGGGLNYCNGTINNCTIADNTASSNGGGLNNCSGIIANNIIWGNSIEGVFGCSSPTYSCYPGATGTGNISFDPMFVDPANGNYHLLPDSPCIDAGNPASDYSLEPMPNGGRIDMGAYGNTPQATLSRNVLTSLGFQIITKTRTGRTLFEYELAVVVRNPNPYDMTNVQMKLRDWDAAVVSVSDDSITIDTILSGATVTSTDTFTIVVDRSVPIISGMLTWQLMYYTVASGDQVQQAQMSMALSMIDTGVPGDISGDGKVNFDDFAIMAQQWDNVPGNPSADIAPPPDGHVGIEDLMYLAENWMNGMIND